MLYVCHFSKCQQQALFRLSGKLRITSCGAVKVPGKQHLGTGSSWRCWGEYTETAQCLWCCSAGKLFLCGACAGIQSSQPEPGSVGSPFPSFQALVSNSAVGSVSYCTGNRCSTRIQLSLLCLFVFLIEG